MLHRRPLLSLPFVALLVLSATSAQAGLTGPTPVSWGTQERLAVQAPKGEAAVKGWMRSAFSMANTDKAGWLKVAGGFETRAQMVERVPSLKSRADISFGITPAQLRLVRKVITDYVNANNPTIDPKKVKSRWIEVGHLAKSKQNDYIRDVRAAISKQASSGKHPGSYGTSSHTPGDTVIWDMYSNDRQFVLKMVSIAREVGKKYGVKWG